MRAVSVALSFSDFNCSFRNDLIEVTIFTLDILAAINVTSLADHLMPVVRLRRCLSVLELSSEMANKLNNHTKLS